MAGFVFELEALLRQRLHAEREQMTLVARLESERMAIESELRRCQRAIVQEKQDLAERLGGERAGEGRAVDLRAVRVQANASLHLIGKAQQSVIRLKGVYDRLDKARLELLDRTTKRRAIELLREKRYEAFKREQSRLEQAEQDEMAVMRHGRRVGA